MQIISQKCGGERPSHLFISLEYRIIRQSLIFLKKKTKKKTLLNFLISKSLSTFWQYFHKNLRKISIKNKNIKKF